MLTIARWRVEVESARAAEIEAAERALGHSRIGWFLLGLAVVALAYLPLAWSFHTTDPKLGNVYFWLAILIGDIGPLVVLWCAAKSEEP